MVPDDDPSLLTAKAEKVGGFVQQLVDLYGSSSSTTSSNHDDADDVTAVTAAATTISPPSSSSCGGCCISWQWPLHLALLQANALPKSPPITTTTYGSGGKDGDNTFLLLPSATIPDLALIEYLYDPTRLGGGGDPLVCPTNEVSWPNSTSRPPRRRPSNNNNPWYDMAKSSYATAAAYTVLRGGNGRHDGDSGAGATTTTTTTMSARTAACLAHSIGQLVASGPLDPADPRLVDHAITLAEQYRHDMVTTRPVVRQRYREYGYR
jgi:hypothetical protein